MNIAAGPDPSPLTSRRAHDPGKVCVCGARFFRKTKETLHAYNARTACSARCGKDGYDESHAYPAKSEFTRINCSWFFRDSELGSKCGPCRSGSNFRNKHQTP